MKNVIEKKILQYYNCQRLPLSHSPKPPVMLQSLESHPKAWVISHIPPKSHQSLPQGCELDGLDLEVEADEGEDKTLKVLHEVVEAPQAVGVPEGGEGGEER